MYKSSSDFDVSYSKWKVFSSSLFWYLDGHGRMTGLVIINLPKKILPKKQEFLLWIWEAYLLTIKIITAGWYAFNLLYRKMEQMNIRAEAHVGELHTDVTGLSNTLSNRIDNMSDRVDTRIDTLQSSLNSHIENINTRFDTLQSSLNSRLSFSE